MIRTAVAVAGLVFLASCATTSPVSPAARAELAPGGKLRAGVNFQNQMLTGKDAASGEPRGIVVDIAQELGRRLGVPVEIVAYETAGSMAAAAKTGAWDIAFLGADPGRADLMAFTASYLEVEASYLVPAGSPLRTIADVDRDGVRIALAGKSAYDFYLSRALKHARLVRTETAAGAAQLLVAGKAEALADLKPRLLTFAGEISGSRVLDGRFTVVDQAIGTPAGRNAGASYLRGFVEDIKASGFVARTIEKNGARGLAVVAPPAE
jgi:polar amino acid transport system substrate-binding protein